MKRFLLITCLSTQLVSCSSIDKSMIYTGLAGVAVGAIAGRALSPDRESDNFNTVLGAGVGALSGALIGAHFFKADPDNREMKTMLVPDIKKGEMPKDLEIGIPLSEKLYTVMPDTTNLPDHLKDKIKKQVIVEKTMAERVIRGEGGKTIVIPQTTVIEVDYQ